MSVRRLEARPTCAVCGKPVDEMLEDDDGDGVTWVAKCHGQRERVHMKPDEARTIGKLSFGYAFATGPRRLSA